MPRTEFKNSLEGLLNLYLNRLFILLQQATPQHALSRLTARFARTRNPLVKNLLIRAFIKAFRVNMDEALYPDPSHYASFNEFFTRPLRQGIHVLADAERFVLSPADGVVSQLGNIERDQIFQAKGHYYSTSDLLGGDSALASEFENGTFCTVYLSPRDYHRVHMPCSGTLESSRYLPGELFSVNQITASLVPRLFARNERLVSIYHTPHGKMALVLVGAVIVAGIETVWGGGPHGPAGTQTEFGQNWTFSAGEEMGRFYLGSTAIVLFQKGEVQWSPELGAGTSLRLGQALGSYRHSSL